MLSFGGRPGACVGTCTEKHSLLFNLLLKKERKGKNNLTWTHVSKVNYYPDIDNPTITDYNNIPWHLACEASCWCLASNLLGKRPRREASRRLIRGQSSWAQCYPPEEDQQIFFPCYPSHVISPAPPRTFQRLSPPFAEQKQWGHLHSPSLLGARGTKGISVGTRNFH